MALHFRTGSAPRHQLPNTMRLATILAILASSALRTGATRWEVVFKEREGGSSGALAPAGGFQLEAVAEMTSLVNEAAGGGVIQEPLVVISELGVAYATGEAGLAKKLAKVAGVESVAPVLEWQLVDPHQKFRGPRVVAPSTSTSTSKNVADCDTPPPTKRSTDRATEPPTKPPTPDTFPGFTRLQWGLKAIHVAKAWRAGIKGVMGAGGGAPRRVRVAVLDSGFWLEHPALAPNVNLKLSKSFVDGETLQYQPELSATGSHSSHGTWTATIIAGADLGGAGSIGVAPEAELMLCKVLSDKGTGTTENIASAIKHAISKGADIINMSLGMKPQADTNPSLISALAVMTRAMALASAAKVTVIASAGNDHYNFDKPAGRFTFPASIPGVIAVRVMGLWLGKVTVIASAGNDHYTLDKPAGRFTFPASSPGVIAVRYFIFKVQRNCFFIAAQQLTRATGPYLWGEDPDHTAFDRFAPYSNYGSSVINFAAPGGNTRAALEHNTAQCSAPGQPALTVSCAVLDWVFGACCYADGLGYYYSWSAGTSASAPYATGVVALMMSKAGRRLSPARVLEALQDTADDIGRHGTDARYGDGRVNAGKIVDYKFT
ncbi:peptidase S8/S53 domain-containing protein [Tribonema minus]|uniref:subtilisin n=1 Tax=Tribonema minus TaxID=303371 RepID=A0A835YU20_9STRA|nr:peptidase S8/S53 domain-containing protein [Tribonema minus]